MLSSSDALMLTSVRQRLASIRTGQDLQRSGISCCVTGMMVSTLNWQTRILSWQEAHPAAPHATHLAIAHLAASAPYSSAAVELHPVRMLGFPRARCPNLYLLHDATCSQRVYGLPGPETPWCGNGQRCLEDHLAYKGLALVFEGIHALQAQLRREVE